MIQLLQIQVCTDLQQSSRILPITGAFKKEEPEKRSFLKLLFANQFKQYPPSKIRQI